MTEKGRQLFLGKNMVTPSVAASSDTNASVATVKNSRLKLLVTSVLYAQNHTRILSQLNSLALISVNYIFPLLSHLPHRHKTLDGLTCADVTLRNL